MNSTGDGLWPIDDDSEVSFVASAYQDDPVPPTDKEMNPNTAVWFAPEVQDRYPYSEEFDNDQDHAQHSPVENLANLSVDGDQLTVDPPKVNQRRQVPPRPLEALARGFVERWFAEPLPSFVVFGGIVLFSLIFSWAHIQNHRAFGTFAFDTGIYDQAVWAMGRSLNPFMTVRGLAVHGHHTNPILFALVPISWLGGGASSFLTIQTVVFAAGAWPVYLIGRKLFTPALPDIGVLEAETSSVASKTRDLVRSRLGASWLACTLALAYLLSPVVEWINQSHWHPEALSATPFLWAWWFAMNRRWKAYGLAVLVVLSTREEAALAVVMLGIVLIVENRKSMWTDVLRNRTRRRDVLPGFMTVFAGLAWFLIATKFVIPAFNNGRPPYFFKSFFGTFGGSAGGIVKTAITDPGLVVSTVTKADRIRYMRNIGLPTLFIFLASPLHCLIMLPSLVSNLLTDNVYARELKYQYAAVIVGPMWIATMQGVARIKRHRVWLRRVVGAVFIASLVTNINFSPSQLSKASKQGYWSRPTARSAIQQAAIDMVPRDAGVAATYTMLPHLDQRKYIYTWPNPFKISYWGNYDPIKPTPDPDPLTVTWIVADRNTMDQNDRDLLLSLAAPGGRFRIYFDQAEVVVLGPLDPQKSVR